MTLRTLRQHLDAIAAYDADWASPDANNCASAAKAALEILNAADWENFRPSSAVRLVPDPQLAEPSDA